LFRAGFYIIWYVREVEVDQRQLVADYGLVDPSQLGPDCPEELRFHQLPWYRRCYPQAEWFEPDQASAADRSSRALAVWCSYFRFGRVGPRLGRAAIAAVLMFVLGILVAVLMSYPDPPVRGATTLLVERLGVTLAGLVFLWLYFLALDSMLLTTIMLRWLVGRRVHFEPEVRASVTERFGLAARDVDLVDRYLSLRIIGRPTHLYGEVIFWPVVVLVLMMLARWSRFDAWGYPQVDQVLQAVLAVMVIASAVTLRRRGDHVKREVLDLVRQRLDAASGEVVGSDSAENRRRVHALQRLLAHIETMQEGVFKPWRRHPIVKTALLVGVVLLTVLNQVLHVI
jgi:hypothetical protein